MGRRAHKPDPALRRQVEAMAAYGIPETDISRVVHIDPKTLRKHYREELDLGESKANAHVAGFLFNAAKNGNVTAQIFWLKTRARWRETPVELRHSGSIGRKDLSEVTDEELLSIIYTVGIETSQANAIEANPMTSLPDPNSTGILRLVPKAKGTVYGEASTQSGCTWSRRRDRETLYGGGCFGRLCGFDQRSSNS
jgi:hypothetical protein